MKKKLGIFLATIALMFGGISAANAYNYTQGPVKWQWDYFYGSNGVKYCGVWAYVDYSFWEEISYPWPKDGWKRLYYAYC